MSEKFDVIVPVKQDLKKGLVFGLKARPAIGIVLSFVSQRKETLNLMQNLSHTTRAFIENSNGLNGFLPRFNIMDVVNDPKNSSLLDEALSWQVIDFDQLEEELRQFASLDARMNYLSRYYPSLFIFILKSMNFKV